MSRPEPAPAARHRNELPAEYHVLVPHETLRPAQAKALDAGLLDGANILIATPTASGKTLIGFLALARAVHAGGKGIYLVPLKALAAEKAREAKRYPFTSTLSVGDYDEDDAELASYDIIITTPEKLDSLLRHNVPWIARVGCIVIDEVHLLGDSHRGPTLELLITLVRTIVPHAQLVALSATVQNAAELASWLDAKLVIDTWRPVELREAMWTPDGVRYRTSSASGKTPKQE